MKRLSQSLLTALLISVVAMSCCGCTQQQWHHAVDPAAQNTAQTLANSYGSYLGNALGP
jgi:hypothetical protein